MMQAALDVTADYVHEREQFGQKIGTFQVSPLFSVVSLFRYDRICLIYWFALFLRVVRQLMQGKLADMYTATRLVLRFIVVNFQFILSCCSMCRAYLYTLARAGQWIVFGFVFFPQRFSFRCDFTFIARVDWSLYMTDSRQRIRRS
jgi:hypothetical protein